MGRKKNNRVVFHSSIFGGLVLEVLGLGLLSSTTELSKWAIRCRFGSGSSFSWVDDGGLRWSGSTSRILLNIFRTVSHIRPVFPIYCAFKFLYQLDGLSFLLVQVLASQCLFVAFSRPDGDVRCKGVSCVELPNVWFFAVFCWQLLRDLH